MSAPSDAATAAGQAAAPAAASAASSSSGLTFKLHPLVIVNVSDHHTRVKAQAACSGGSSSSGAADGQPPRVFGCVIGVQRGRTVEIFNSFELVLDPVSGTLDRAFLEKKQELYKKVFPDFYVLGWYSTGSDVQDTDMQIHKALMDVNESPVYLLLNPAINLSQKDLPVTIYESVAAHLTGIHSAIKMLNGRVRVIHQYLVAMQKGDIPVDNSLLRQVSSLVRRLPAMESQKFQDDFLMEYNDTLLMTYLAMFTNCSSTMNELVEKINTSYERPATRRGGRGAFM
ncbi:COP9 signalosome complex subunit 6a [Dichanthelium oligosanthes]|uniref:COP9 signalosome complex subunit 6 n=1 Tax=Dichanthelium oligosanthes TaxID=888268 RepID=A0A1E5W009_9POAL|nr:COP9 signalosome complex subunit 6a [Dichanthelium oligosanthes]